MNFGWTCAELVVALVRRQGTLVFMNRQGLPKQGAWMFEGDVWSVGYVSPRFDPAVVTVVGDAGWLKMRHRSRYNRRHASIKAGERAVLLPCPPLPPIAMRLAEQGFALATPSLVDILPQQGLADLEVWADAMEEGVQYPPPAWLKLSSRAAAFDLETFITGEMTTMRVSAPIAVAVRFRLSELWARMHLRFDTQKKLKRKDAAQVKRWLDDQLLAGNGEAAFIASFRKEKEKSV